MKYAVIIVAFAALASGGVILESGVIPTDVGNAKFTVEIRLSIAWIIHQHKCNGALIDGEWILAPAQCVKHKPFYGSFEVLAGSTAYNVKSIIIHERADNIAFDIALLRLAARVPYSETVQPINLPFPEAEYWDFATVYKRRSSGEVQANTVSIKSRSECTETPKPITVRHICAGDQHNSVVKGDEGSALAVSDGLSGNVLIGLLSFAKPEPASAVFTKVSYHVDWILGHLSNGN